ncbi:AAA family ATPase [Leifsonia sp. NPDC058292]|uniref:MinD/ParA family ATP-binding protein n=1 Tax=Leifsonia sp. NPDC058292 TaxID=3346428 RepID=UPI0036DEFFFA
MALDIPALPLITARFGGDNTGELSVDGVSESIDAESTEHLREQILTRVTAIAAELGRPVQMTTQDDEGQWMLVVHPDGEIGEEELLAAETQETDPQSHAEHPHPEHPHRAPAAPEPQTDDVPDGVSYLADFLSEDERHDSAWHIDSEESDGAEAADDADPVEDPDEDADGIDDPVVTSFEELLGGVTVERIPPAPLPSPPPPGESPVSVVSSEAATQTAPSLLIPPLIAQPPMTPPAEASPLHTVSAPEPAPTPGRASFLAEERQPDRAKKGWRGFLAKTGLPIPASTKELTERAEVHAVSQHWAGPRTIAIVNGKGGANKTPTTAMLAAVFARNGGSGVLAWDNNETRGTLGWRTEQGTHDATVQTLLPNTDHLLSPGAQSSDLSHFVHHQTGDKYDVLRSNPTMLATQQRITTDDFDQLHSVAAKYFRLIFIDSGNDESAERWLRMIDHTDQLVIATTALGEHAEAGALLLEALAQRDERSASLASGAVVVVSQSEKTGSLDAARKTAAGFEPLARRAVAVPYDAAMHGGRLEYSALAPASRRAWLHAAAAVAEGL